MLQKSKMATQGDNKAQSQMVVGTWTHYKAQLGKVSCGMKWPQMNPRGHFMPRDILAKTGILRRFHIKSVAYPNQAKQTELK